MVLENHRLRRSAPRRSSAARRWLARARHPHAAQLDQGKSIGAKVKFAVADVPRLAAYREVFTTRIDTIYGVSAVILAPTHPLLPKLLDGFLRPGPKPKQNSRASARASVKAEELATAEKEGFFTGRHVTNPFNGAKVPIWVGNFVLMEYGTGAVMAVPAYMDQARF